jgi:aminoacrylate hydrolase
MSIALNLESPNFFQSGSATIAYHTVGSGPAVLLIQGTGLGGRAWGPQVDFFASNYSVTFFDNRGIGKSSLGSGISIPAMAEDAKNLLDHLGVSSAHIVGHSLGGVIAQELALRYPSHVKTLALLCTFPRGGDALAMNWPKFVKSMRTALGSTKMRRQAFLELVSSPVRLKNGSSAALYQELAELFGRELDEQPPTTYKQLLTARKYDRRADLKLFSGVKTLVLSAQYDLVAPPGKGRELAASIPGARYIEVQDEGHAVTVQDAEHVNGILRDFWS